MNNVPITRYEINAWIKYPFKVINSQNKMLNNIIPPQVKTDNQFVFFIDALHQ